MSESTRALLRLLLTGALAVFVIAAVVTADPPAEDRAQRIGSQIRCPVCSGESIAASPNQLATDMMGLVRELIARGYTDDQVIEAVIAGYDDAQRLSPPFNPSTAVLWALPGAVLIGGGAIALNRRRPTRESVDPE